MHDVNRKKSPGAIFNVACDDPQGDGQDARHKKSPGAIFNVVCDGLQGDGQDARRNRHRLGSLTLALAFSLPAASWAQQAQSQDDPDALRQEAAASGAEPRVNINEYVIRGNTVLTNREIEKAVYPFLGPQKTLGDVEGAQAALQKVYQDKGYHSVYVALPEQRVQGGIVYLQVTETRVGRVRVVGAKYHSPLKIRDEVPALAEDKVPDFRQVQEQLTAVNRGGDREVTPTVKEGAVPGTMDVDLNVTDRNPWSGSLTLNNDYSADTEKLRAIATLRNTNLWQKGHSASLTFFTAPQEPDNATVWSASYGLPLNERWSLLASGYHSDSDVATIGGTNVLGKGYAYGLTATYTLPLADAWLHSFSLGLDLKDFDEEVQFGASGDKVPLRYAPLTLAWNGYYLGERRQGNVGLSLVWATSNFLGYGSDEWAFDYKRYKADPDFALLKGNAGLTQAFADDWQLALTGSFQAASGPLVSNEQISAGGAGSVRGYLASEHAADDGVMGSIELRTPSLAPFIGAPLSELRLYAFADGANLWLRDALAEQKDRFDMASVGVGSRASAWSWLDGRLDLGWPLIEGEETEQYSPRLHFSVSGNF
ncbi:ShlB/FhaC/HecB family hemolysin secretion/activation protein [Brenneria populi subsp. brevivirga]|uniref:ShlB/FhaC/HecB family hemolysin secretion/activation protein n=1 Tax=Brenneria populi TaxID=1505588 RepID=UPI002E195D3F|nr:ShlB/FhaC/HecB family hemolysin secretion/activation protein [Brenneria populi subsp. brevivirga]